MSASGLDPVAGIRATLDAALCGAAESLQRRRQRVDLHGARKQLKRARALVQLLRNALGDAPYRRLNAALRSSARPLSTARDAEVLLLTLNDVAGSKPKTRLRLTALRKTLRADQQRHDLAASKRTGTFVKRIDQVRGSARKLKPQHSDWGALIASLKRTYRKGRRAHQAAKDSETAEHLHEWRKQAKYYWHQLEALQRLEPRAIAKTAKDLHKLSDLLGDDHDLFVLSVRIEHGKRDEVEADTRTELQKRIDRKRRKLQRKAFALGARLYARKPKEIERRFADYCRTF